MISRTIVTVIWQSVVAGITACLAAVMSFVATAMAIGITAADRAPQIAKTARKAALAAERPYLPLLIGPVFETLLFLIAFKSLEHRRFMLDQRSAMLTMAVAMGVVGWLLHGASRFTVAQGFGFAVLGAYFAAVRFRSSTAVACLSTALAHVTWNSSLFVLATFRSVVSN